MCCWISFHDFKLSSALQINCVHGRDNSFIMGTCLLHDILFFIFFSSVSRNPYLPKVCLLDMRRENIQPPGEVKVEIVNCMDRIPELELTSPSSIRVRSVHFPINLCVICLVYFWFNVSGHQAKTVYCGRKRSELWGDWRHRRLKEFQLSSDPPQLIVVLSFQPRNPLLPRSSG